MSFQFTAQNRQRRFDAKVVFALVAGLTTIAAIAVASLHIEIASPAAPEAIGSEVVSKAPALKVSSRNTVEPPGGDSISSLSTANVSATESPSTGNGIMGLNKESTAIVFIEFQQEWLSADGTLRQLLIKDEDDFNAAVQRAERILKTARDNGWRVVHAGLDLRGDPDYMLFNYGRGMSGLRAAIPKAGTWTGEGAEFAAPFVPRQGEFVVRGRSGASVLKNSTLDPYLRNAGVDTIVFLGFALHVCVESSVREAHDLGYNVIVPTDASGVFESGQRAYFEDRVIHHFGEKISTDDLLKLLGE